MDMLNQIMSVLSRGCIFAGACYIVWNGIQVGFAIKDHNGPEMKSGLLGIAGGIVVITAAGFLTQIVF